MYENLRHKISNKDYINIEYRQIFLFLSPESISKVDWARPDPTRPVPTMTLFNGLYLGQYYRYGRECGQNLE